MFKSVRAKNTKPSHERAQHNIHNFLKLSTGHSLEDFRYANIAACLHLHVGHLHRKHLERLHSANAQRQNLQVGRLQLGGEVGRGCKRQTRASGLDQLQRREGAKRRGVECLSRKGFRDVCIQAETMRLRE